MISSAPAASRTPATSAMRVRRTPLAGIRRQYRLLRHLGMADHSARRFIFDLLFDGLFAAEFVPGVQ